MFKAMVNHSTVWHRPAAAAIVRPPVKSPLGLRTIFYTKSPGSLQGRCQASASIESSRLRRSRRRQTRNSASDEAAHNGYCVIKGQIAASLATNIP